MPGSSSGCAGVGVASKNVPRRRGARRDCDRVSKAEDVPEYKGSLPVEELLAFVEGSAPSPGAVRMPGDAKLRRTKRKEPLPGDGDLKFRNGDSKLVEMDVPLPPLACLHHSEPLNELLNGSSQHPQELVSGLPVNFDTYVDDPFPENEWLSTELANHLMVNENYDDGIVERKEKEFVLVQKKRRPKIAAAMNDSAKNGKPLNELLSKNGIRNTLCDGEEEYTYMNGFGTADILETNGSTVSRNSSEGSLAQSFSSGIDDLSHFIGEDGHSGGEQYVDAPLSWNNAGDDDEDGDDREVSLSSFCSTMSSTESRQRLNSPSSHKVASPDIDQTDVLSQDGQNLLSELQQLVDSVSIAAEHGDLSDNSTIPAAPQSKTDCSTVSAMCSDRYCRCIHLCCTVPYKHFQHQTPVVFCDSRPSEDVSSVMFSFGCMMSDHLVHGGLCTEATSTAVLPDTESEMNGIQHLCSESSDDSTASTCDGVVSFMYSDSILQCTSPSMQCIDLSPNCTRNCNVDVHSNTDSVDLFQVGDVQSYMYASECRSIFCSQLFNSQILVIN